MKNKIVGLVNIIFGLLLSVQSLTFIFITIPNISSLYKTDNLPTQTSTSYFLAGFMLILGIANLFYGATQFSKLKLRYFKFAFTFFVINCVLVGLYIYLVFVSNQQVMHLLNTSF